MAIVILIPALATASEPTGNNSVRSGASLLNSLKSRSASRRWDLLDKTDGPVQPRVRPGSKSSPRETEPGDAAPLVLRDGPIPDAAAPFPDRRQQFWPPMPLAEPNHSAPLTNFRRKPAREDVSDRGLVEPNPVTLLQPVVVQKKPTRLKLRRLADISPFPDYRPPEFVPGKQGDREPEKSWKDEEYRPREFSDVMFPWEASNLWHNPLYFEDAPLERYGHTYHPLVQPFVSVKLFTTQLLALPYQMAIDPVPKRIYTLGWYRPGEGCVPKLLYPVPWNSKAAAIEAGVVTGLFFLIP